MNLELAGVAERLTEEFPDLPVMAVIGAVCECTDACDAGPFFVEQAARARLAAQQAQRPEEPEGPVIPSQTRAGSAAHLRWACSLLHLGLGLHGI